jgi:hypothetical protein
MAPLEAVERPWHRSQLLAGVLVEPETLAAVVAVVVE